MNEMGDIAKILHLGPLAKDINLSHYWIIVIVDLGFYLLLFSQADIPYILTVVITVTHKVVYGWNTMNPADRGLTAGEIFDMTVADNIENGAIGNLTVVSCLECNDPQGMRLI